VYKRQLLLQASSQVETTKYPPQAHPSHTISSPTLSMGFWTYESKAPAALG